LGSIEGFGVASVDAIDAGLLFKVVLGSVVLEATLDGDDWSAATDGEVEMAFVFDESADDA
jgi:hypothetical protein